MMFNGFNPVLAAASQPPTTPLKPPEGAEEAMRLFGQPASLFPSALFHQMAAGGAPNMGAIPFPLVFQGMQPGDLKPEMLANGGSLLPFFDAMSYHPYALDGGRRKNATRETTAPLKQWLKEHHKNPYPTKADKVMLAVVTKMSLTQVSTWFANARRRLKKENKMTWTARNRPGEEDDDDMADILDRPSSSTSDQSDTKQETADESNNNDNKVSPAPSADSESPKKNKIWSIAETVSKKDDDEASSSKKDSPASDSSSGIPAAALAQWQQQQLAFAAMAQMQGMPPNLLAAFAGGAASPMQRMAINPLFNQLFMASMMRPNGTASNGDSTGDRPSLSPNSSPRSNDGDDKPPTLEMKSETSSP